MIFGVSSNEAWYQANEQSPAGLDEMVFLLMICSIHMLDAGQARNNSFLLYHLETISDTDAHVGFELHTLSPCAIFICD